MPFLFELSVFPSFLFGAHRYISGKLILDNTQKLSDFILFDFILNFIVGLSVSIVIPQKVHFGPTLSNDQRSESQMKTSLEKVNNKREELPIDESLLNESEVPNVIQLLLIVLDIRVLISPIHSLLVVCTFVETNYSCAVLVKGFVVVSPCFWLIGVHVKFFEDLDGQTGLEEKHDGERKVHKCYEPPQNDSGVW